MASFEEGEGLDDGRDDLLRGEPSGEESVAVVEERVLECLEGGNKGREGQFS